MRVPFSLAFRGSALHRIAWAAAVAVTVASRPVHAQVADAAATAPVVGLALSGGSAKGLAHVGVLLVLEEAGLPVHRVAGTSMGAIIGGLYAMGYAPMQLDSIVRSTDWPLTFRDTRERRYVGYEERAFAGRTFLTLPIVRGDVSLPSGVVAGQRIGELLARLTWPARATRDFRALPRPFVAVATDLASGDLVVLDTGSLAGAMRASSSLPTIFEPARHDGRTLIDGYVVRNLPAPEVRQLGADVVVCSDVTDLPGGSDSTRTLLDVFARTLILQGAVLASEQQAACDVLIRPDLSGLGPFSFDAASEWIRRGETAARAALPALRDLARRAAPAPVVPPVARPAAPATIADVTITGVGPNGAAFLRGRLRLRPGTRATPDTLAGAVERAFASGVFRRVSYDVSGPPDAAVVHVAADAQAADRVGLGVRYDSWYNASLLLAGEFRHVLGFGTTARLDLRLGEQVAASASVVRGSTVDGAAIGGAEIGIVQTPFDLYDSGRRVAQGRARAWRGRVFAGTDILSDVVLGVDGRVERGEGETTIAQDPRTVGATYPALAIALFGDRLDRTDFPTRGGALRATLLAAGGGRPFRHALADWRQAWPLARHVTLVTRVAAGQTSGDTLPPPPYLFTLGGALPPTVFGETQWSFPGLAPQERLGTAAQLGEVVLQWEFRTRTFASVRYAAGQVQEALRWSPSTLVTGTAVSVGGLTPLGPVEVVLGSGSRRRSARVDVRVGYTF